MYPLRDRPTESVSPTTDAVTETIDGSIGPRILVVEDTDGLRAAAVRTLAAQGYVVTEARHGQAALQLIEQATEPFDLVVTDVVMPVMSGYKLGRRLAACRPELPVLYMSACHSAPDEASARHGRTAGLPPGLTPFLQKPFLPEDLVREVAALLGPIVES